MAVENISIIYGCNAACRFQATEDQQTYMDFALQK
jgi:hypothetical protein